MKKPPKEIDGAKVLEWAWSGSAPFGTLKYKGGEKDGQVAVEIYGLAICQYQKTGEIYRFSCNENWETKQDAPYDSIQQAKDCLPDQYKNIPANWIVFE
jgi:hypothetical protein